MTWTNIINKYLIRSTDNCSLLYANTGSWSINIIRKALTIEIFNICISATWRITIRANLHISLKTYTFSSIKVLIIRTDIITLAISINKNLPITTQITVIITNLTNTSSTQLRCYTLRRTITSNAFYFIWWYCFWVKCKTFVIAISIVNLLNANKLICSSWRWEKVECWIRKRGIVWKDYICYWDTFNWGWAKSHR